jgi:hypothetical protein
VFSAFNDIECLKSIARYRGVSHDDSKEKLINELALNISAHGLELLLRIISPKELKALAKNCNWNGEKISSSRAALAKKIYETMEEMTPRKFLESCDSAVLKEIIKESLQLEVPSSRKDYTDEILRVADTYGLENCFSSFTSQKLKEFIKACGLKVDTDSMDVLLQCLMEQESIKLAFKSDEPHSEIKPPLDKDIKTVDLHYHFFREDLSQWCDQNELSGSGSKTELIRRIRRFFDGKSEEKDKKKVRKPRKSEQKSKTTETPEQKVTERKTPIKEEKKRQVEQKDVISDSDESLPDDRKRRVEEQDSDYEESPRPVKQEKRRSSRHKKDSSDYEDDSPPAKKRQAKRKRRSKRDSEES